MLRRRSDAHQRQRENTVVAFREQTVGEISMNKLLLASAASSLVAAAAASWPGK